MQRSCRERSGTTREWRRPGCETLETDLEQRKRRPEIGPPCGKPALECLQRLNVLRLPALGALDDVELNGLTFLKTAEASGLNRRIVNEYVFAVLTANEAVALRVIEPLNCSLFHCVACSFGVDIAAIRPEL